MDIRRLSTEPTDNEDSKNKTPDAVTLTINLRKESLLGHFVASPKCIRTTNPEGEQTQVQMYHPETGDLRIFGGYWLFNWTTINWLYQNVVGRGLIDIHTIS